MAVQRAYESKDLVCNTRLRKGDFPDDFLPICAKDYKTLILAAFFGDFLSLKKESYPPEA